MLKGHKIASICHIKAFTHNVFQALSPGGMEAALKLEVSASTTPLPLAKVLGSIVSSAGVPLLPNVSAILQISAQGAANDSTCEIGEMAGVAVNAQGQCTSFFCNACTTAMGCQVDTTFDAKAQEHTSRLTVPFAVAI